MKWVILVLCCIASLVNGVKQEEEEVDIVALVKSMEKEVGDMKATVHALEMASLRQIKLQNSAALQNFTGFTAYASATREFDSGDTVTFDGVLYNHGNAYNSQTSTFTCPISGYYYFDLHIYESNGRDFGATISLNSTPQTKVYIAADLGDNLKGSTSVVVYCQLNQQVLISCADSGELEGNTNAETSFSGFLVGNV